MNAPEIETWLIGRVAEETGAAPDSIDPTLPFARLGLDSAAAVGLTDELEELLGFAVDPTLIFEYPTIRKLADLLAKGPPPELAD